MNDVISTSPTASDQTTEYARLPDRPPPFRTVWKRRGSTVAMYAEKDLFGGWTLRTEWIARSTTYSRGSGHVTLRCATAGQAATEYHRHDNARRNAGFVAVDLDHAD